ncbi:major facilitator superfamily domain-containing protein [Desarmillaria tabescens]|uniref:Major facilitator superfamily domain-containing protein n=1 Tax=Armillaria tabescens TaxID=1929756 RepID=A0AA39JJH3_ARMTA|nr:major facilitator superfamily domain-containing protein [Desarmillaria tabescens]KAK0443916.1 major facilitator superfamily domain-containing protein [Desarmillaria tabescens]
MLQTWYLVLAAQDKTPWYRKPNLRLLYILLFPTCIGVEMTSGFDSSMMNGLQAVDSWDTFYHSPRSTLLGLMSAIYSLGAIVVLPIVPYVTDHLGRRWAIVFGSILMIIGAALQAASHNFAMFVCSRLVLGFGIPFAIVAASSLIGELSHPKERAILGSLFNSCWFIGSIVAAGITLGTFNMDSNWGWRIPSLVQVVPSLMQVTFIFFIPDSPRWLISRGRGEEAYAIPRDVDSEFVKAEYAQIEKTLELEKETAKTSWMELVTTSGMRKRLVIGSLLGLFTQWSGNGLTSYYLARILDNVGTGTISILLIFTGWTVASANYTRTESHGSSVAVIVFIFLYSPAYNMAFNALTYTFLVELFPFHVRAKGITVFQWFSRMAGFFNQFVNPIGIANAGWKYYLSYVVWILIEVLTIYFLFPETAHKTLEELSFLYESDIKEEQNKRVEEDLQGEKKPSEQEDKVEVEHVH